MNEPIAQHDADRLTLGAERRPAMRIALVVGAACLAVSAVIALWTEGGPQRFLLAYLVSYCFFLSVSLGALFFVMLQHVTRAGWSVGIRRLAENLSATMPMLAILAIPIVVSVAMQNGSLYPWARGVADLRDDHAILAKRPYLNPAFFIVRLVVYLGVWSYLARWFLRLSKEQDQSGAISLTRRMEIASAPALVVFGITVTLAAFDLIMSLDPHWYSTIFGVYFFASCAIAGYASLILAVYLLQRRGYLREGITPEHYHDLGKFLFGFTFFWGYIAFSQYMLLWYANIPEETAWLYRRGLTTATGQMTGWTAIAAVLLLGQLLIPFAGLMSRSVKRHKALLAFWAAWALVFHWVDLYWLIMPELDGRLHFGVPELGTALGLGGIFVAYAILVASRQSLRPMADPRLEESLAFENV
ncbi:MAG TPA: hypothetical protein VHP11_15055 [Tepidisphaeraceae bacterium]|nr:hypothetical protein [Tepidisphaeraceae bacterium]